MLELSSFDRIFCIYCLNFAFIGLICLEKRPSSPFMIDLLRLKAFGTGLAFGYAIDKDCDKRFQAHGRRRPGQVTFNIILSIQL